MFKKYGVLGILLMIFVQINFFLRIQPFLDWSFPILWMGYVLVIDALVYKLRKNSLISNRFPTFLGILISSSLIWWVFEFINLSIGNWVYIGLEEFGNLKIPFLFLCFSLMLPAFFETYELVKTINIFENKRLHKKHKITKRFLFSMIGIGMLSFVLPFIFPKYTFFLVWGSFFFILDPINYVHKQPSIIGHIKNGDFKTVYSLLLAGIVMGFLWEYWNFWMPVKWTYDVPFVGFLKIFEMPLFGYIGYLPFSFEVYAMYWFLRSLFIHREHILE
ncbi:MAG: hypothetical protein J7K87_04175 [Candidatus Aenigmarchaeota archaeon]|nr:hypothetical protein [Candidatus Aenigmarchaeota archaeon]